MRHGPGAVPYLFDENRMESPPKKFARRVLLIHGFLLVGLIVLVVLMMGEVYQRSRQQAIEQTRARQALLASQTANGIEQYYRSIFDDLDLFRRAAEDETSSTSRPYGLSQRLAARQTPFRFGRLLWRQLQGRASSLVMVDKKNPVPLRFFPDDLPEPGETAERRVADQTHAQREAQLRRMIEPARAWLRNVTEPTIGPFEQLAGLDFNLIAIPTGGDEVLLAVVPAKTIQMKFIDPLNSQSAVGAWLLDEDGQVVSSFVHASLAHDLKEHLGPKQMKAISTEIGDSSSATARIIYDKTTLDHAEIWPSIVNVHPTNVGGKHWRVIVASPLEQTDQTVAAIFGRAVLWAIFVVVSMSAILVSTAIQLIRGRARLRHIEHEILQREIKQARQIQLTWLPPQDHDSKSIQLAAVNQPANQISGDFYNWFDLPDGRKAIVIGDVTGHGMAAAFLMATTQLLLRSTLQRLGDASAALGEVNRQLCSLSHSGQFVTMLLMVVDLEGKEIEIVSAGHYAPLVHGNGSLEVLAVEPHYVLGIEPEEQYKSQYFSLENVRHLLLYTDGVLDAEDQSGKHFGMDNLRGAVGTDSPRRTIDAILARVNQFAAGTELADDLTLLAVKLYPTVSLPDHEHRRAVDAVGLHIV
jgi:serine phosphatase RsbU (regulator of sigma subunit)